MQKQPATKKQKRKLIALGITCGAFLLLLIVQVILRQSAAVSSFLARTLSRGIVVTMSHVTSLMPFSTYEAFLYISILSVLFALVLAIVFLFKRCWNKAARTLLSIVLAGLVVGTTYFSAAGFAYSAGTNAIVPIYSESVTDLELKEICDYFLEDFNDLSARLPRDDKGWVISPYTDRQLSEKLRREYMRLDAPGISRYTPHCKTIASSRIMSEMHIRGVFFAPFGEANINKDMPDSEKPYTMAHEMAHAKGVMVERDANAIATWITLTSDDDFIRYSGYMEQITYLFSAWAYTDNGAMMLAYWESIDAVASLEMYSRYYDFWGKYTLLEKITSTVNDAYLKLMGQKEGTGSYSPAPETEEKPVTDPDTGQQVIDPETDLPVFETVPVFDNMHKLFFQIYKSQEPTL